MNANCGIYQNFGLTFDEIVAFINEMNFRDRRRFCGAQIYYRAGHSFQGDGGPTVTWPDGTRIAYQYATDAARSLLAGQPVSPVDGTAW